MWNSPRHVKKKSTVDILEQTVEIRGNVQTQASTFSTRSFLGKSQITPVCANRTSSKESIAFLSVHLCTDCLPCPVSSSLSSSSAQHTVIEGQTHHGLLVAAVFPLDLPGLHAPQTSQVVWGGYRMGTRVSVWYWLQGIFTLKISNVYLLLYKRVKPLNSKIKFALLQCKAIVFALSQFSHNNYKQQQAAHLTFFCFFFLKIINT